MRCKTSRHYDNRRPHQRYRVFHWLEWSRHVGINSPYTVLEKVSYLRKIDAAREPTCRPPLIDHRPIWTPQVLPELGPDIKFISSGGNRSIRTLNTIEPLSSKRGQPILALHLINDWSIAPHANARMGSTISVVITANPR
jgi:hypothetical protein